jgi:hypothetical protein
MVASSDNASSGDSPRLDWIELHDKLPVDERGFMYHERNQRDWWEQNKRIRQVLREVELELKNVARTGKLPSVRLLSCKQLAERIGCHRATLLQVRRYHWVNEWLERLRTLLKTVKEQKNVTHDRAEAKLSEVESLKISLQKQRDQTAIYYSKNIILQEEVADLKRLLAIRERKM